MKQTTTFHPRRLTLTLALAMGTPTAVWAAGFQLLEQTASGIGNAYAGSAAVAENAGTIFANPAGMTQLQAHEFSTGLTAVKPSFKFSNANSSSGTPNFGPLGPTLNVDGTGNGGDGGSWGYLPNLYYAAAVSKGVYLGFGIGAPFGLKTEYNNPWIGGAQSLKFDIRTININPSIAFKVTEQVSLGFGLDWQKIKVEYQKQAGAFDIPNGVLPTGPAPLFSSVAKLNGDDTAWGWNAGATFSPTQATRIGIAYRSKIKYTLTGNINVSGPSAGLNGAGGSPVTAEIKLPDSLTFSVTQKLNEQWEMLGDLSWTGWSSIPKVDIIRTANTAVYIPGVAGFASGTIAQTLNTDFRNTWRVALGGTYAARESLKYKFGIAYDQTPVKGADTRLVSLPDNDRVWLATGVKWMPSKASAVDVGIAYLYVRDAQINNNQQSTRAGLVNGTYKDSSWILGAQYSINY